MRVSLCLNEVKAHTVSEALIIATLEAFDETPVLYTQLAEALCFVPKDKLDAAITRLMEKDMIDFDGVQQGRLSLIYQRELEHEQPRYAVSNELGNSTKNFLARFGQKNSVLENKIQTVVYANKKDFIDYAIDAAGLDQAGAEAELEKFLAHVRSSPDKNWDRDIANFWSFWLQNSRQKHPPQKLESLKTNNQRAVKEFLSLS